jgi:hypothetical protein
MSWFYLFFSLSIWSISYYIDDQQQIFLCTKLNYPGPGCRQRETLQYLCEQIPGDALLFSMFKENAEPVKCPLKGMFLYENILIKRYIFSYLLDYDIILKMTLLDVF